MIILPTRRRLERRRDALYKYLDTIVTSASVHEVEDIMRKIHSINIKLRTYFIREGQNEATELFETEDPLEAQDPFMVSLEEYLREIEVRGYGD